MGAVGIVVEGTQLTKPSTTKRRTRVEIDWLAGPTTGLSYTDVTIASADLTEAVLTSSTFQRCEFVNARFNCATITDCALSTAGSPGATSSTPSSPDAA